MIQRNHHPDDTTMRGYRQEGADAYRRGVPYTYCPYLPFSDCPEGMAWKNGWLAEKERATGGETER